MGLSKEQKEVKITFAYERKEYVKGIRFRLRKSYVISWVQVLVLLVALGGMGVVLFLQWPSSFSVLNIFVLVLLLLVSLYGLYLYFLKPGMVYNRTPELSRTVRFLFTQEDIARQDSQTAVLLDWQVQSIWSSREFYFLFEGKDGYMMLPKRAFSSPEACKLFELLVAEANPGVTWKYYD